MTYKHINKGDKLIIISGPTASGKTSASINLAKAINGEVISCDSMQVYKYMDIGSAKPTKEEMEGIRHHLIDVLEPNEDFSIATFKEMVFDAIEDIKLRGKTPILCGGTGFYTNAIVYNTEFTEMEKDDEYREELFKLAEEKGNAFLYNMLREVDPESLETIHENNTKKVVRALEFYKLTNSKISTHNKKEKEKEPYFDVKQIILNTDRETLYNRIDRRVDIMLKCGLVEEVNSLIKKGYTKNLTSMQGIGYQEFFDYFDGKIALDETIELIKKNSRNYAKRQLTWFRNKSSGIWVDTKEHNEQSLTKEIITLIH